MAREAKKNRERKDEGEAKRFTFSLSTAGVVSLAVVAVAALAWVFILGVLVGRGYKPEQAVPQLAEIMPRPEANASAEPPSGESADGVLKPEELEFFDAVKKQPAQAASPKIATKAPSKPKSAATAKAERDAKKLAVRIARDQALASSAGSDTAETDSAKETGGAVADAANGAQFRYVYQTASLRKHESADSFAAKLQKLGFKTSIEQAQTNSGTWFRVLLHHTGTPESTREIKEMLQGLGVQKPIMKSKTPL